MSSGDLKLSFNIFLTVYMFIYCSAFYWLRAL